MANKKVAPELKVMPIAGCVHRPVLLRIRHTAIERGVRVSKLVGEILTEWVERNGGGVYAGVEGQEELFE